MCFLLLFSFYKFQVTTSLRSFGMTNDERYSTLPPSIAKSSKNDG